MNDIHGVLPLNFFHEYTCLRGFVTRKECGDLSQPAQQKKCCSAAGITATSLTLAEQIHGTHISIVTHKHIGKRLSRTDGLITTVPDVPLAIFTADCLSVFLYSPDKHVIGLLHAGWRGTAGKIVVKAVDLLINIWNVDTHHLKVIFGPYIHSCCYRVARYPVVEAMREALHDEAQYTAYCKQIHNDEFAVDLGGINRLYLERSGVPKENIDDMDICTYERGDTFSYRREGKTAGRMMSLLLLKP